MSGAFVAETIAAALLIVEGVYTTCSRVRDAFDYVVWVECPREERLRLGLARDGTAARQRWTDDWMPKEDEYVRLESPHEKADLVVSGGATRRLRG